MSRIRTHTVEDAPAASRPVLQNLSKSSPTGRFLNLHAQMAHSPAVLAAYTSLRGVIAEGIASRLAQMSGWAEEQIVALRTGTPTHDAKIDVLTSLIREATANSGNVTDATWKAALQAGWSDAQLTDAFAYLGLTVFTGYFLNYAQTDKDALW
jgi:hypothetical protein